MTTTTTTKAAAKKECHERQTELYVEAGTEFDKQYGNICETCYANRFFCSLVRSFVVSLISRYYTSNALLLLRVHKLFIVIFNQFVGFRFSLARRTISEEKKSVCYK